ncbi:MAG: phosphoribosylanthranilate isomerase [Bradyrhizobium sp.]
MILFEKKPLLMNHRTRIKICGLTRDEDVAAAIAAGTDAIGLVFYPPSPRSVTATQAAMLLRHVPPFITTVGLFVNATLAEVEQVLRVTSLSLLQFHGDETPEQCAEIATAVNRPYVRAIRVGAKTIAEDLLKCEQSYRATGNLYSGLLFDTLADSYGGTGKVFDWSLIPEELAPRVVLSGGLSAHNATEAVVRLRPFAVDVSSGVEIAKGIKDATAIARFIAAVRLADIMPA